MKNTSRLICILFSMMIIFSSCEAIHKLTYKNQDFEYVNKKVTAKIVIQSTRDKGFRFVVTDPKTVEELYDSLSSAMPVTEKIPLEPDYIFEFHSFDTTIKKFYYVAGTSKDDTKGNLYNDKKTYVVMNRIDNEIIRNMFSLRKPSDFVNGYYGGIEQIVKKVKQDYPDKKIGVMVNEDAEMLKYHLSFELVEFQNKLKALDVTQVRKEDEKDVVINITTVGYYNNLIKIQGRVKDNVLKKEKYYYLRNVYDKKLWNPSVTEEKPSDF